MAMDLEILVSGGASLDNRHGPKVTKIIAEQASKAARS
jgi:hypothetical protein